ncbi:hypothetical protein [Rhodoglobus vestalii]|uniref:hypothetical protein n=1 Tax=Rhodoglobus vestalii TaxID=193384 RepID=UPI001C010F81|nr:hypothetical protein [Rhodoglobus vestalii]
MPNDTTPSFKTASETDILSDREPARVAGSPGEPAVNSRPLSGAASLDDVLDPVAQRVL